MLLEPAGASSAKNPIQAEDASQDAPQIGNAPCENAEATEEPDGLEGKALEEALDDLISDIEHEAFVEKAEQRPPVKYNGNTALEIAEQIHQVQEMLTAGVRPNVIRRYCADEWGLSTRTAEKRMADARRKMVTDANCYDRTEKVGQMLQQLEKVLEDALKMRQGSNAIGAIRLQADLLQLLTRQN